VTLAPVLHTAVVVAQQDEGRGTSTHHRPQNNILDSGLIESGKMIRSVVVPTPEFKNYGTAVGSKTTSSVKEHNSPL